MKVKLLRKVAKHISEEPKRLNMFIVLESASRLPADQQPDCGTIGCIAGWACALSGVTGRWSRGRELLGLNSDQAERLFNPPDPSPEPEMKDYVWPVRFARRYLAAKDAAGRAKATVARIEHFIKTKGAE